MKAHSSLTFAALVWAACLALGCNGQQSERNEVASPPAHHAKDADESRREHHILTNIILAATGPYDCTNLTLTDVSLKVNSPRQSEVIHYFADFKKVTWVKIDRPPKAYRFITETNTLKSVVADFESLAAASNALTSLQTALRRWQHKFPEKTNEIVFTEWTADKTYGFTEEDLKGAFNRARERGLIR